MDAVTREYTHLLTSQLESQRQYFEELRVEQSWQYSQQLSVLQSQLDASQEAAAAASKRHVPWFWTAACTILNEHLHFFACSYDVFAWGIPCSCIGQAD
jgi:hypothetical protein